MAIAVVRGGRFNNHVGTVMITGSVDRPYSLVIIGRHDEPPKDLSEVF
jgi:hypothetical protein